MTTPRILRIPVLVATELKQELEAAGLHDSAQSLVFAAARGVRDADILEVAEFPEAATMLTTRGVAIDVLDVELKEAIRVYVEMVKIVGQTYHPDTDVHFFYPQRGRVHHARTLAQIHELDEYDITLRVFESQGWL